MPRAHQHYRSIVPMAQIAEFGELKAEFAKPLRASDAVGHERILEELEAEDARCGTVYHLSQEERSRSMSCWSFEMSSSYPSMSLLLTSGESGGGSIRFKLLRFVKVLETRKRCCLGR